MTSDISPATMISPDEALALLLPRLRRIEDVEIVDNPLGRVLAAPICADRDQPPVDLSMMDGYAVRVETLRTGRHAVVREARAGADPGAMPETGVVRIVTGAGLPAGADAVVKREDVSERDGEIEIGDDVASQIQLGDNVRRRASAASGGDVVVQPGLEVSPATLGTMALYGRSSAQVFRKVRVGLLATGDEVLPASAPHTSPWQVRDASAPAIVSMFASAGWCEPLVVQRVPDDGDALRNALTSMLERCDAVFLTGGVSKGHRDFVPDTVRAIGGRIIFHRLAQRPGHPALGAVTREGGLILGLPGNPMSSLCVARRLGAPAVRWMASARSPEFPLRAQLIGAIESPVDFTRYRPAVWRPDGRAELMAIAGSADIGGAAPTDGFVEIPAGSAGDGPFSFYPWGVH